MAKLTAISVYEHIQKDGKWTYLKTGADAGIDSDPGLVA